MRFGEEEIKNIAFVKDALEGLRYVVFGGIAAVHYGSPRTVSDFDIFLHKDDFNEAHKRLPGATPIEERRDVIGSYKMFSFPRNPSFNFYTDIFVRGVKLELDDEMLSRAKEVKIGHIFLPVIAVEDLLIFKALLQRGPKEGKYDLFDIARLRKRTDIDWGYVRRKVRELGCESIVEPLLPL